MDCYDTCVISLPDDDPNHEPAPLQTCADLFSVSNVMTVGKDAEANVIIEIYPPTGGSNSYTTIRTNFASELVLMDDLLINMHIQSLNCIGFYSMHMNTCIDL